MIENSYINYVAGNNSFTLISLAHSLKIGFPEGASPKTRTGEEGSKRSNYLKIAAKQYYPHSYRWREKNIATRFYFRNTYLLKNFGGTYEKLVTVIYGRTLDGLPVKGASRIAVRMGINGELVGLVRNWPELNKKTVSSKDMIASPNRIDHLKRHLESLYDDSKVESVSITDANIVMYDDGRGTIEPAMFVLGEITQKDGFEEHADWMVPLLRRPKARYSILERVPVYPDNHKVDQTQGIKDSIIEDDPSDT